MQKKCSILFQGKYAVRLLHFLLFDLFIIIIIIIIVFGARNALLKRFL
jgi:hypothetical protein